MGLDILGRIGRVIDHNIDKIIEIIVETRTGFNQKAPLYNPSGEDSPPVKNDRLALLKIDGTGKYAVVGVLTQSHGAKPGEKYFYSRNADGEIQSIIKMLEDGTVEGEIKKDLKITVKADVKNTYEGLFEKLFKKKATRTYQDDVMEDASGKKYSIKGMTIEISGDTEIILKTIGSAAWFPNCVPTCPFGFPHGGEAGGIMGLKGK
jgi:hypothetical protein